MKRARAILPGLAVAGLVLLCSPGIPRAMAEASTVFSSLQKFTDCLDLIEKYYVDKVDTEKLVEGAIKGMTSTLDPHSAYLSKEDYREMQISTTGSFGGLGIELGIKEGR